MPGARCTRGLIRKGREGAHEHTGSAEAPGHPLHNGFTAYSALSPVIGLVCHRRLVDELHRLDASVGRQDHTALPSASVPFVFDTACVHRIPRQRFVTTMIRPSERARDSALIQVFRVKREAIYFCNRG